MGLTASLDGGDLTIATDPLGADDAARYRAEVLHHLGALDATPAGRRQLLSLKDNVLRDDHGRPRCEDGAPAQPGQEVHRRTTIRPPTGGHGSWAEAADPAAHAAAGNALWFRGPDGARGRGTDVDVFFDPTRGPRPDVVLAHELEHARHQTQGTMAPGHLDGVPRCELQAIGLGDFAGDLEGCTENTYRRQRSELGDSLPPRRSYLEAPPPAAVPVDAPVPT
jgi:hypothetical protein